jgi:pantothenate kinase
MRELSFDQLLKVIVARCKAGRSLTAIAGPPGSGKSYLAERLLEALNQLEPSSAVVIPMDGYHYDDILLNAWGLRARKGAPETFDVLGFGHMLRRLADNTEDQIAIPIFDRKLEIARAGAQMIERSVRYLLVEGNYLLLDREPWTGLRKYFETTVMLKVDIDVLRERLTQRWIDLGLEPALVRSKVEGNDMPNVLTVLGGCVFSEFEFRSVATNIDVSGAHSPAL